MTTEYSHSRGGITVGPHRGGGRGRGRGRGGRGGRGARRGNTKEW